MTDSLHSFSAARLYARPEEAPTLLLRVSVRKAHLTQCLSCAKPISAVLERLRKKAGKVLGPGAQVSLVSADRELVDPSLSCDSIQSGHRLTLGDEELTVVVNPPTIWRLQLPPFPAAELPVIPVVDAEFHTGLRYCWYRESDGVVLTEQPWYLPSQDTDVGEELAVAVTPLRHRSRAAARASSRSRPKDPEPASIASALP